MAEVAQPWTKEQLTADESISKKQIIEFLQANASSAVRNCFFFK